MTTAAPIYSQRPMRRSRPVPRGEATKVILALVLNAILFGMMVF
jgi:hypothetical protein